MLKAYFYAKLSVDVCIGYNALYSMRKNRENDDDVSETKVEDTRPSGVRVWTWLLLLADQTVVSITEDSYPNYGGSLPDNERRVLLNIRSNLINVFKQLSKMHDAKNQNAVTLLPFNRSLGDSDAENSHRPDDAPSLLFYYLFDDWVTTYSLITNKEHQYSEALSRLVRKSFSRSERFTVNNVISQKS